MEGEIEPLYLRLEKADSETFDFSAGTSVAEGEAERVESTHTKRHQTLNATVPLPHARLAFNMEGNTSGNADAIHVCNWAHPI